VIESPVLEVDLALGVEESPMTPPERVDLAREDPPTDLLVKTPVGDRRHGVHWVEEEAREACVARTATSMMFRVAMAKTTTCLPGESDKGRVQGQGPRRQLS
jgi:hypothetical protein